MTSRIRIVSDIHTEFHADMGKGWVKDQDPTGVDVLVIAGDLGTVQTIPGVLDALCEVYPQVVMVSGNHEYYGSNFDHVAALRKSLTAQHPNLHWLHNSTVTLGGQRFVGTTLWFRDDPLNALYQGSMNDFRRIGGFANRVYKENAFAVRFLQKNIQPGDVVVTHHLPSDQKVAEQFRRSTLNRFYVCYMETTIMAKKPALWCHGHSHTSMDYTIGQTRIRSNPFGYAGHDLNAEHDENLIVTL